MTTNCRTPKRANKHHSDVRLSSLATESILVLPSYSSGCKRLLLEKLGKIFREERFFPFSLLVENP
jgi:hypothetical protein